VYDPFTAWGSPEGFCVWCGARLGSRRRRWCDAECSAFGAWWYWLFGPGKVNWKRLVSRTSWRDHYRCQECGLEVTPCRYGEPTHYRPGAVLASESGLEVHHILPRSEGGADEDSNLITLCCACHDLPKYHPKLHHRAFKKSLEPKQLDLEAEGWDEQSRSR
jgi:5-methylcytosine-specific restriction endonuclease McrA